MAKKQGTLAQYRQLHGILDGQTAITATTSARSSIVAGRSSGARVVAVLSVLHEALSPSRSSPHRVHESRACNAFVGRHEPDALRASRRADDAVGGIARIIWRKFVASSAIVGVRFTTPTPVCESISVVQELTVPRGAKAPRAASIASSHKETDAMHNSPRRVARRMALDARRVSRLGSRQSRSKTCVSRSSVNATLPTHPNRWAA